MHNENSLASDRPGTSNESSCEHSRRRARNLTFLRFELSQLFLIGQRSEVVVELLACVVCSFHLF